MSKLLEGKVALITGGSRGIGEGICLKFAAQGANIAFSYVSSDEKAAALIATLEKFGIKAKGYKSNAGLFEDCEAMVNDVVANFGGIDVCVNNAGISKDNLLLRMTPEQWDEVMMTNLKSVFNMTKLVIKPMMKARNGSIINMSSIIGVTGNAGQSSYAASKAGIIGFTKSIAKEVGSRNIRVNAIAPGFVTTDMTHYLADGDAGKAFMEKIPLGKFAEAEDIANACLFLGSSMGQYITGQTISVCGGLNI